VTPLGSDKSIRVSVRIIAATHRDLKQYVADGRFREDLYYRLAGYEIAVPPLRARTSDIPLLVEHFRQRDGFSGPSQAVLDVLIKHDWPGNVRELEQVIRRTVIDSGALLDAVAVTHVMRTLAPSTGAQAAEGDAQESSASELISLEEAERRHIAAVLRATCGNQTQAAFILGIERKTLARKIKRLSIDVEKP
jgi:transcriptional regulator with GAF, ATPase, and Fis domain